MRNDPHCLILRLLLTILSISVACEAAGGVISVVAPQLVNQQDEKNSGEQEVQSKKLPLRHDKWWYGALKRGSQTKIASEQEYELTSYLFNEQGYNPLIRPVANVSEALRVDLGLCMIHLIHIDERRQVMKSNVWLPMVWRDYQLTWDPAKYGGLKVIRVPHSRVWKPDIVLFNNADGNYEVLWQPNLLLHHDGSILWMPPAVYESSCAIDVEYFPFDEQECEMKFGSWAFDASRISMGFYSSLEFMDLSDYWRSGTWDLVDVPARIVNTSNGEVNNTYIVYTIKLRRKTLFYSVNLIVPCVMLSLLSVFVFYLPSDAGEKVTLAISIVVALVVFLILVSKILPPTSTTVPLISRYLMFTFVSDILAVFMSVLVVNWNYRSPRTHTMPKWIKTVFLDVLPRFLFMNRLEHLYNKENDTDFPSSYLTINKYSSENEDAFIQEFPEGASLDLISSVSTDSEESRPKSVSTFNRGHFYENLTAQRLSVSIGQPSDSDKSDESSTTSDDGDAIVLNGSLKLRKMKHSPHRIGIRSRKMGTTCKEKDDNSSAQKGGIGRGFVLTEAVKAIDYISEHLEKKEKDRIVVQEWKYAASVIDRLVLVIFTVVSVVVALSLLTNAPSLLSPIDQDAVINKYSVLKKT